MTNPEHTPQHESDEFGWIEFRGTNYPREGEDVIVRLKVRGSITYAYVVVQNDGHKYFELWDDNFTCGADVSEYVTHWRLFTPHPDDKQETK